MALPQRKSIRLSEFDYSQSGYYFITICIKDKKCILGKIVDGTMVLNRLGQIVYHNISEIPDHVKEAVVNKFTIMPNHIHIILIINAVQKPLLSASPYERSKQLVPKIVQLFKASVSRNSHMASIWQSSYYDHIIRSESEYRMIWQYIETNPLKWELDRFYQKA